jgi:hypothetical protein
MTGKTLEGGAGRGGSGEPAGDPAHAAFFIEVLLPLCTHIVHQFITDGGIGGIRMDDGALLAGVRDGAGDKLGHLRINALWYLALEKTAAALRRHVPRDAAGGHFERLAGRFRRSFSKVEWRSSLAFASGATPAADTHDSLSDPDQLILTVLPASPIPRTRQRQILARIADRSVGKLGVLIAHPTHGIVESPLHRAWLAMGLAADRDRAQAKSQISPLGELWENAKNRGIHPWYRQGHPLQGSHPDALATAEVLGALEQLLNPLHPGSSESAG